MVYGELGRTSLDILIKSRMVSYWAHLVTGEESKLSYKSYKVMLDLYTSGEYCSPWIKCIHQTLVELGLNNIWLSTDFNPKWLKLKVKQVLKDQFFQSWNSQLENSGTCTLYKHIKDKLVLENYLLILPRHLSIPICKFRCSNAKLAIVKGRYNNISRNLRFCHLCDENKMGDEYHILFECNNATVKELRKKFIPNMYCVNPSMMKFIKLFQMCNHEYSLGKKLGLYIKELLKIL